MRTGRAERAKTALKSTIEGLLMGKRGRIRRWDSSNKQAFGGGDAGFTVG
jgi:hypothetical protein